jgi:hypothetical protein
VSQDVRRFTKRLRVKMKVPPDMVRVKYKTSTCCGVEVDTPRARV